MRFLRELSIIASVLALSGCYDRALKLRTEEIRALSDRQDRMFTAEALAHIERQYWTLHDRDWYGKLPDSTIVRLNSPQAIPAPLPGVDGQRGWHLQLTITSPDWRTYPDSPHTAPFSAIYAITRYSATSWDIRLTNSLPTTPLHHEDALRVAPPE